MQVLKVMLNINRLLEEKGQNCLKFQADFVTISQGRQVYKIPANVTNFYVTNQVGQVGSRPNSDNVNLFTVFLNASLTNIKFRIDNSKYKTELHKYYQAGWPPGLVCFGHTH